MLRKYITIAIRNLNKYRFYTIINVFGLTIGISACLIILLFVQFELSYDKFNLNADRIVRVDWELYFGGKHTHKAAVTPPMADVLVRDYPEVEAATRFRYLGSFQFKRDVENTVESRVVYADNDLFKIFTIPFIAGNPENALKEPHSMVISEQCAKQFFPDENALGKTLIKDNKTLYTVTGIVKDLPENSHFHYRMFLSMEGLEESKNGNWIGGPYNTYLLLQKGSDRKTLEDKLPDMLAKYLVPQASSVLGASFMDEFVKGGSQLNLHLRPLLDIHLHSNLQNELEPNGDIKYVYLFSAVAAFILVIACINFMNLATARSIKRAREVGIRKVMGSTRSNLTVQFLSESVILTALSFVVALAITSLVLPTFNLLTDMHLAIPGSDWRLGLGLALAAVLVGVAAGLYPGFVLSAYQPAHVLKGKPMAHNGSSFLRRGLVVFQFAVSMFLIIATLALYRQMNFIQQKKLGFDKEQVIRLRDVVNLGDKLFAIKEEMTKNALIKSGTVSSYFPGPFSARKTPLAWRYGETPSPDNSLNMEEWTVDYDYVPTLGMEIVAGRNFSRDFPSDSSAVILNETAIRDFGFADDPIGHNISVLNENPDGSQDSTNATTWTIVGVVKDFNFESLRQRVTPLGLFFGTKSMHSIAFRFETGNTQAVIETLRDKWKTLAPGEPFHYAFLDQDFERLYTSEKKLSRLFMMFSGLAIIIACLGLFALTAFTAEQRTKEIGIRKVMGATVQNIVLLLSREFSKLVLAGFLFAAPLAAYGIYWYLQQYAYKTDISLMVYLEAGILAFLLAALTMGFQSIKAANTNPVNALKNE
ncbi:MAG TPA: ABC transporter permease [Cyclobacteriaceae bacterium]|nr:ABC transporter permease [Cyclobacteriaceae bacterium]